MAAVRFQYHIRMPFEDNPRGRFAEFEERIRAYFVANDLDYGMGALGGGLNIYGEIQERGHKLTDADRRQLAEWIQAQPIQAVIRLGGLELDDEEYKFGYPRDEWVFEVDNLTPKDKAAVQVKREEIQRQIESLRKKRD